MNEVQQEIRTLLASITGGSVLVPGSVVAEVVNFDETGMTVSKINKRLRKRHKIFGGKDLSQEFPEVGESALYCVTEVHTKDDIDRLGNAVREVVS